MLSDSPIPPPPPLEDVPPLEAPPATHVEQLLHQNSHHQQYVLSGTVNRGLVLWAQRSVEAMQLMRRQQTEYRSLKEQHTATSTSKVSSPTVDDGLTRAMRDARPTGQCPTPSELLDTICSAANVQEEVIGASRRSLCATLQQHQGSSIPCEVLLRSNHQYIFTLLPSSVLEGSSTYLDALLEEYSTETMMTQPPPSQQMGCSGGVGSKSRTAAVPTPYEDGFCAVGDRLRRGLEACLRGATKSTDPTTGASLDHKRPTSRLHGRVGSGPQQRRGKVSAAVFDDGDEEGPMSSSSLPFPPTASSSKLRALHPRTSYNFANAMALACNPSLGIGAGPRPPSSVGVSTVAPPQMDAEVAAEILVLHSISCKQRLASHTDQKDQKPGHPSHEDALEVLTHINRSYGNVRSVSASGLPPSVRAFYYAELQGIPTPCTKVPDMRTVSPTELPPPDALLEGLRIGTPTIVRANSAASDSSQPSPSVTTRMGSGWLGVVPTRIHQRTVPDERSCGSSGSVSGALRRMVIAAVLQFAGHDDRYFVVMDEVLLLVCGMWEDEGVQSRLRRANSLAVLPTGPLQGSGSQATTTEALMQANNSMVSSSGGAAPPVLLSSTCGQLAAPIAYLTSDVPGGYMLLRSQYIQLWMPLQQPSLELLVTLSAAETFIVTAAARNTQIIREAGGGKVPHGLFDLRALMRCFQVLKLAPLSLMADWIGGGFVSILRPHQVLELWDRVLSLHNYHAHTERHAREKRAGGGSGGVDMSDKSYMWNTAISGGSGGATWVCGTAGLPVISPAYLLIAATAAALFLHRAALLATATCQAEARVLYHIFAAVDITKLLRDFLHVPSNY